MWKQHTLPYRAQVVEINIHSSCGGWGQREPRHDYSPCRQCRPWNCCYTRFLRGSRPRRCWKDKNETETEKKELEPSRETESKQDDEMQLLHYIQYSSVMRPHKKVLATCLHTKWSFVFHDSVITHTARLGRLMQTRAFSSSAHRPHADEISNE